MHQLNFISDVEDRIAKIPDLQVDPEDLWLFIGASLSIQRGYVFAGWPRSRRIPMHQIVNGRALDLFVDHINGHRCDNRRENLRFITPGHSGQNRLHGKVDRGVSVARNAYRATCQVHYIRRSKTFRSREQACIMAELWRRMRMPYALRVDIEGIFGYVECEQTLFELPNTYEICRCITDLGRSDLATMLLRRQQRLQDLTATSASQMRLL